MPISKVNGPQTVDRDKPFTIEGEPMLKVREAAQALRVSQNTVYRLIRRDKLPYRRIGKQLFVLRDGLVSMINQSGIPL